MSGQNNQGYVKNWIRNNFLLKIIIVFVLFIIGFLLIITVLSNSDTGINPIKSYNQMLYNISNLLNNIPLYNSYTKYIEANKFYTNYKYGINEGFINIKFWIFWAGILLEMLPLFLTSLLFLKKKEHIKQEFLDYEKQLKFRSLKPPSNPEEILINIIKSEGTYKEDESKFDKKEIKKMSSIYVSRIINNHKKAPGLLYTFQSKLKNNLNRYIKDIQKLRKKYPNELEWNQYFKKLIDNEKQLKNILYMSEYEYIDYKDLSEKEKESLYEAYKWNKHFIFIQELNKNVSRELYLPSKNKELDVEELFKYYRIVLLFWLAKQTSNFPMYTLTINLDIPIEFKKISKWSLGRNAPGKTLIAVNPNVPRKESRTRSAEIYYRIYKLRSYIGIENEYMLQFLNRIEQKLDG